MVNIMSSLSLSLGLEAQGNHVHRNDESQEDECSICYNGYTSPVIIEKCHHIFCRACLEDWHKKSPTCPLDREALDITKIKAVVDLPVKEKTATLSFNLFFCDEQVKPMKVDISITVEELKKRVVDALNHERPVAQLALAPRSFTLLLLGKGEAITRLSPQKKLQEYGLSQNKSYEISAIAKLAKNGKIPCDDCYDIAEKEATCKHDEPKFEDINNIPDAAPAAAAVVIAPPIIPPVVVPPVPPAPPAARPIVPAVARPAVGPIVHHAPVHVPLAPRQAPHLRLLPRPFPFFRFPLPLLFGHNN
jgi:hypothetical protein